VRPGGTTDIKESFQPHFCLFSTVAFCSKLYSFISFPHITFFLTLFLTFRLHTSFHFRRLKHYISVFIEVFPPFNHLLSFWCASVKANGKAHGKSEHSIWQLWSNYVCIPASATKVQMAMSYNIYTITSQSSSMPPQLSLDSVCFKTK